MYHFISIVKLKAGFKTINSDKNHITDAVSIEIDEYIRAKNHLSQLDFFPLLFSEGSN